MRRSRVPGSRPEASFTRCALLNVIGEHYDRRSPNLSRRVVRGDAITSPPMSEPTTAQILARTLQRSGVDVMFGLPGGEILDFIEAARHVGIRFVLTRHEATAAFMADVTGQILRRPGVCVSTLGPGAINMTLGVANAFLDRSPMVAITASLARGSLPYATHQQLDLNAVYRPFTKHTVLLDGAETGPKVQRALDEAIALRMGPVHIALPSDVAR